MKIIDLSVPIYTGMPVYPGDPNVTVEIVHTIAEKGWELRQLFLGSHTGTHVDACSHMHEGAQNLDEIHLGRFLGRARVAECGAKLPGQVGLFFTEEIGLEHLEKIREANPGFVGGEINEDLERALLGVGIITFTNLVNLDLLPRAKDFFFIGLPLKISGGDGSPVRAIAILYEDGCF